MHTEFQPAYILHTRPYRDTSMLVDFLTPEFGRVTAVARGVRTRKTLKRNLLNPFARLLISFQGKSNLKLLTHFEREGAHFPLIEKHLFSGFYVNEILVRLLPELDAHPDIFQLYETTLAALSAQKDLEATLRQLELQLLIGLGYGVDFCCDTSGDVITADKDYALDPLSGFSPVVSAQVPVLLFSGQHIQQIALQDFSVPQVRHCAKKITRLLMRPLLGGKPLMSRALFG
jgi:DNA repair protein RecO (recombination protein O)